MLASEGNPLVLYVREGCHLCEDMHALLFEFSDSLNFQFTVVDIDESPMLSQQYNDAVPLLLAGATEICRYYLDLRALQTHLSQSATV